MSGTTSSASPWKRSAGVRHPAARASGRNRSRSSINAVPDLHVHPVVRHPQPVGPPPLVALGVGEPVPAPLEEAERRGEQHAPDHGRGSPWRTTPRRTRPCSTRPARAACARARQGSVGSPRGRRAVRSPAGRASSPADSPCPRKSNAANAQPRALALVLHRRGLLAPTMAAEPVDPQHGEVRARPSPPLVLAGEVAAGDGTRVIGVGRHRVSAPRLDRQTGARSA